MKLQMLVASVALAFGASAFAQATPATPAAPATPATPGMTAATPATPATPAMSAAEKKTETKKAAKKHTKKHTAKAKAKKGDTKSMGAGPASPVTDLEASSRQARIDAAYANWKAGAR